MQISEPIPELGGRTWAELEAVEHPEDGCLLFKDKLRKRTASGKVEEVDVRVRVLRPLHIAQARARARGLCKQLDLDIDKDSDLFDEVESICQLSLAIRTAAAPYPQFADPEELMSKYEEASLKDILGRIKAMGNATDVRLSGLTEQDIWPKIHAVAEVGHLLPLTDIAGHEQPSCIVFMARRAMESPRAQLWLPSPVSSTPEPSPSKSSDESSAASTG